MWGVATAAYQVEGAAHEDGRGPSIWDMFCRKPGKVWKDQNADISADHYHRFREDVALMRALGVRHYRFSVSWSRVLPNDATAVNGPGLAFYDRLVDALLQAGIAPWVTLYHWDLPLWAYRRGGFLNRDVASWFGDYTAVVADKLGDRVVGWMPLNEPQVFIGSGLQIGRHAPGDQLAFSDVMRAAHNTLRCHGTAVQVVRARAKRRTLIGTAQAGVNFVPASERAEDVAATRRQYVATDAETMYSNALWLDPMVLGRYPDDYLAANQKHLPPGFATSAEALADLALIKQPLDFVGVNQYDAKVAIRAPGPEEAADRPVKVEWPVGYPITGFDWPVTPDVLYWTPRFLYERYRLPIYIMENGLSCRDWVAEDGHCHDPNRVDFLRRYLRALRRASAEGIPVHGYFHWSFLDNFEWAEGYKHRFGLVHVDYATGKRTPKDSAYFFRDVMRSNGANLGARAGAVSSAP